MSDVRPPIIRGETEEIPGLFSDREALWLSIGFGVSGFVLWASVFFYLLERWSG